MKIYFEDNEFTTKDLINYLTIAYGTQINGSEFTASNVLRWIQIGKLPDAYGGNKITNSVMYPNLAQLRVLTIENLSRTDIENYYGEQPELNKKRQKLKRIDERTLPKKQRTQLYYDILGSRNATKKTKISSTIPNNWRDIGIRASQLKRKKRSNKI